MHKQLNRGKIERSVFQAAKNRVPEDLNKILAENGYDEWLDTLAKYVVTPLRIEHESF